MISNKYLGKIRLCARITAVFIGAAVLFTGCANSSTNKNTKLSASNVTDREEYLAKKAEDENKPMKEQYRDDDALLFEASGPRIRIYITSDDVVDGIQKLNNKGEDIAGKEKLSGLDFEDAIDILTERAVVRGYLSDNNKKVSLSVENTDPSDKESITRAEDLVEKAADKVESRMGIHGIEAEIQKGSSSESGD